MHQEKECPSCKTIQEQTSMLASKIYESLMTKDGKTFDLNMIQTIDAIFEAMMWVVSGPFDGMTEEEYEEYLEHAHDNFHIAFEHAAEFGYLSLTNNPDNIIWDDTENKWTTSEQLQKEAGKNLN